MAVKKIIKKILLSSKYTHYLIKNIRKIRGDVFGNQGPITAQDFEVIKNGIEEVKPKVFIEIGTGVGSSAEKIYNYLKDHYPDCHFYTMDIFKNHITNINKKYSGHPTFHALLGLSVSPEETTPPARDELADYHGPVDILRHLLEDDLKNRNVDIAFIDSRKGSALAEFMLLEKYLSAEGIIFCHDILNEGKGVEVLDHLKQRKDEFTYEVADTSPMGMITIRMRK